ncbi:hypothetical protein SK571_13660 [Lentzea sp. BCCO 10_0798]|uniref:HEPN domain-containing protein n=1 Tax=Lentzea kristufekii TaxID=3095430 RepID=A0ABU4TQ60_9PSEU|nr:hypothetical protein [Lentzea sp. BCCO 10_0798]MDX8050433.1 hypothetical protein [Lentzea sp. BCCO 10_0798]
MSRVARSAALAEVVTCQLMIRGLERQAIESPPRTLDAQRAAHEVRLRAYRAYARAAASAAPCYREGSAARLLAEATATALNMVVATMQRELDRTTAGA